ncbi:transposase [Klebsiella variicola]
MKKSRFTEQQIVFALKLADPVSSVPEACRKQDIYDPTFYTRRKKRRNISYRTEAHAVVLRYGSAVALYATVLCRQTTAHCARVSVGSPRHGFTIATGGFTLC